jgi:Yip1 domain
MTPETVIDAEPQPRRMSEMARLTGVFFEPKKTFEDIAQRPSFLVPLILILATSLTVMITFGQHVGWERFFRQQMENNTRLAQTTPEQREQVLAMQVKFASVGGAAGIVVGLPVYYLIAAAVLMGIVAGIMSAPVRFKQVYAIMCYASLTGVIAGILTLVVMFLKSPDQFNLQNALAFNPGAFLDPQSSSKFVYSLATSLDLFSFWTIFLIATGLKAAAGKKLSFGGALFSVILPWAVYVLGKSALAGVFG